MSQREHKLDSSQAAHKFVCVFNRNRDDYEVALALHEAGLLDRLVTEFYSPDSLKRLPHLSRRHRNGLSSRMVNVSLASFAIQYGGALLRRSMRKVFAVSDRLLARHAHKLAQHRRAGLYAYSSYFEGKPELSPGCPVIDFEYHPHPAFALDLLASDVARHPEAAWSFKREQEVAATESLSNAWEFADAVVCASSVTKRSLIHAGCPVERITVVPYGAPEGCPVPTKGPAAAPCRFLFVGQGIQRKGLHHLSRAWRQAGLANAKLAVISYLLDPGIAPALDQPGITVLGRQDRAALNRAFAEADVFVLPSLIEGFGLVYLEALNAGCHVIGTTNTGLVDLHLSAKAATLIEPGDIDALAVALNYAAQTKALGQLDPEAIQREAQVWTRSDFRRGIADHARQVTSLCASC